MEDLEETLNAGYNIGLRPQAGATPAWLFLSLKPAA
jgi:hypothetical protein|tara:strand:- start:287 stop:394 length:108 start_codon:yes stop_codon:yes gene_type:complete